ncbi:MAG TPA: biopolymer transporter ExbD [Candidatus Eisenbacteria bacterium]|nr:biopolymer transporter ExbD [Candidatus Eisenbacteria bacterium]
MKLRRRVGPQSSIPTASMADIAMLLLIFFMSTSIIRSREAMAVRLPGATAGERIRSEETIRISVGARGDVAFNDARVPLERVGALLAEKLAASPALAISLHADARTPYAVVAAVMDQLREAQATRVTLATTRRGGR